MEHILHVLSLYGTLVCSSDSRLKYNINNISYGLDAISKLRAIDFNWINESANNPKNLGFIAQEVEQIIPELVSVDVDGYKQFNSIGLIPVLTKSIQELNTKIEGLDITPNGSIVVNYNVSPEVLASLGYSGAKNELENGSDSLTDNLGQVVTRVGQFG